MPSAFAFKFTLLGDLLNLQAQYITPCASLGTAKVSICQFSLIFILVAMSCAAGKTHLPSLKTTAHAFTTVALRVC